MHFLVDPIVLCLPEPTAKPDQIEYFFEYLANWREFIQKKGNKFYVTEECYYASVPRFPFPLDRTLIQECLRNAGDTLDATTVSAACMCFAENFPSWPCFEAEVSLPDLLVHLETMCLAPDLVERTPSEIAEFFQETFGYVAYSKEIDGNHIASALYLLTYPVNGSNRIEIGVTVADDKGEHKVETHLPIVETPEDIRRHESLTDIWEDTKQAIDWAKDKAHISEELSPYTVGKNFNLSLKRHHFHDTNDSNLERCFEKIAQLLAGHKMKNNQHLKNAKDTEVDGETWKAWRLRITSGGGDAYRLHYWTNGSNYVFSNVVKKDVNDDEIDDIRDIVS